MIIVITLIELKSPFKFFALASTALQIVKQLKTTTYLEYKNTGFWTKHYTMSSWDSVDAMHQFARSGAHLSAMKKSANLAREILTLTYESDTMPNWKEGKRKLYAEGKVLNFDLKRN